MNAVADFFDSKAPQWDQTAEPSGDKHCAMAWIAGIREGSRVLDLGCGTGIMAPAYLHLGASEVVALDVSSEMIRCAQEKYADEPRLRFMCCDALDYQDDELFDAVVIYNAYPHFMDKQALVHHVAGLLKPEGRFLVAHGMSRAALNDHHGNVPEDVTSDLMPVRITAKPWTECFDIDQLCDADHCFYFGGRLNAAERAFQTARRKAIADVTAGTYACVCIHNGQITHAAEGAGIGPVLRMFDAGVLKDAYVVDKIIGKAAAMILHLGGAVGGHGVVISDAAVAWCRQSGMYVDWTTRSESIINRTGTGLCPMEQAVREITDEQQAYAALKAKLEELRTQ